MLWNYSAPLALADGVFIVGLCLPVSVGQACIKGLALLGGMSMKHLVKALAIAALTAIAIFSADWTEWWLWGTAIVLGSVLFQCEMTKFFARH